MGTEIINWEERLAQFATEAVAAEAAPAGSFVSSRGGILQWQGQAVAGNKLDVIVIDAVYENALYEDDYDPDNPATPVCFAFAHEEGELVPHELSTKPQHDKCAGCPQNAFGSAARGKGKACKNIRRLSMLPATPLTAEAVQSSEVAFMKLPVTSGKFYTQYVNTLATVNKRPPFAMVTTIGAQPDAKTQYKVTFTAAAPITDSDVLNAVVARHEAQKTTPTTPYQPAPEREEPAPKGGKKKF